MVKTRFIHNDKKFLFNFSRKFDNFHFNNEFKFDKNSFCINFNNLANKKIY